MKLGFRERRERLKCRVGCLCCFFTEESILRGEVSCKNVGPGSVVCLVGPSFRGKMRNLLSLICERLLCVTVTRGGKCVPCIS